MVAGPHADANAILRGHFLRVFKYDDAQRRIQPKILLSHRIAQRVTELFELAECLVCGRAAIVADRLGRTELRPNPLIGGKALLPLKGVVRSARKNTRANAFGSSLVQYIRIS